MTSQTHTDTADQLHEWYAAAVPGDADWYAAASAETDSAADELGIDRDRFAGAVAALSPRMVWSTPTGKRPNIAAAARLALDPSARVGLPGPTDQARRILAGADPLAVLTGPKTRSFYRALRGDSDAVVIDAWVLRAMAARPPKSLAAYDRLADQIRTAAAQLAVTPAALQAAVWSAIRRAPAAQLVTA